MPRYMIQASYTTEAKASFVGNPRSGLPSIRKIIERLGGRLECLYHSFGEYDVVVIYEADGDVTAVAAALAATGPGHLQDFKTTRLITNDEFMEAMRRASGVSGE